MSLMGLLLSLAGGMLTIGLLTWGCTSFIDTKPQNLQGAKVRLWQELNWWRYEPAEGWHLHFNIDRIPMAMHLHLDIHGRILPPTWEEIYGDINQWTLVSGLRVRLPSGIVRQLR